MQSVTFITGNQNKANYLNEYLNYPIAHKKLDLVEIQSMDLREVVEYKAKEAYSIIKSPVLVDDVSVEFEALGGMPGPFIKFMLQAMSYEEICRLFDGKSRKAYATCIYGYYDGKSFEIVQGHLYGSIADKPEGENGFGWDKIFIVDGDTKPRATLNKDEYLPTMMLIRPLNKLKKLLERS